MKTIPILFSYADMKERFPRAAGYYAFVSRGEKNGIIKKIKKGLYALVNPSNGSIFASKFQIGSKLFDDSYFSYHEALEYYGLANQSYVSRFHYLSNVHVVDLDFEDILFCSIISTCDIQIEQKNGVRVVTLERAIVDSIDRLEYAGGLEEVQNALEISPKLNMDKVVEMLEFIDKAFLYQKVGYLFERAFGEEVPDAFYKMCLDRSGKATRYLDSKKSKAKFIKKWNLMVPKERDIPNELF